MQLVQVAKQANPGKLNVQKYIMQHARKLEHVSRIQKAGLSQPTCQMASLPAAVTPMLSLDGSDVDREGS